MQINIDLWKRRYTGCYKCCSHDFLSNTDSLPLFSSSGINASEQTLKCQCNLLNGSLQGSVSAGGPTLEQHLEHVCCSLERPHCINDI